MIINGASLYAMSPIKDMEREKVSFPDGGSYGLTEAGYDIRTKQSLHFMSNEEGPHVAIDGVWKPGRFLLASSMELFDMPQTLVGRVSNKSTWARHGVDAAFSTVIEPGWRGYLTLEVVFHGTERVYIPAGSGIVQVLFEELQHPRSYVGKYQDQEDAPIPART